MSGSEISGAVLQGEIQVLQKEVAELRKMLILVASTIAMVEGQQHVSHTYLRRALAKLENTGTTRLLEEYFESEKFTSDLEMGFELMAESAEEMGLQDLAEHLRE